MGKLFISEKNHGNVQAQGHEVSTYLVSQNMVLVVFQKYINEFKKKLQYLQDAPSSTYFLQQFCLQIA